MATADQSSELPESSDRWRAAYGHRARVFDASFSSDSHLLVSASEDCTARVWRLQDLRQTALLSGHSAEVLRVAWKSGSRVVATGMSCPCMTLQGSAMHTRACRSL